MSRNESGMPTTSPQTPSAPPALNEELLRYINLKLTALGKPPSESTADPQFLEIVEPLLRNYYQKNRLLGDRLCPADQRIQDFLNAYLEGVCPGGAPRLPGNTFVLDRPGMARVMSLPANGNQFISPNLHSYRIPQGVLHNPKSDRRTTKGIFHIVEDGFPVPADKFAVPRVAFAHLLKHAFEAPAESLVLPFTAQQKDKVGLYVSLLLRPVVCPATERDPRKTMEIRFFAPASLLSNLDFVESIFGNGGDPFLPENDAALDVNHWTGHTGCVILAPHLVGLRKKDLGLPSFDNATERQKRDGMCWREEDEIYNEGRTFKVACRDHRGVMVTIIADNYYGYCKKEVKTQISFSANLFGLCEEEHAGGAVAYPSYIQGQDFYAGRTVLQKKRNFEEAMRLLGDRVERKAEGYAIDRLYPQIYYVPENSEFNVREGYVKWQHADLEQKLSLRPENVYVLPWGYKLRLEKQPGGTSWRLVGTGAIGTFCHKPCTVSGGGKSEISKSIAHSILKGSVFVKDYYHDTEQVAEILKRDFSAIYKNRPPDARSRRPILSPERSLGSVIKLLTRSVDYTDEHNAWLKTLPQTIRQLVFTLKRYYRLDWGENWREHFTVDRINGFLGHELKYDDQKLIGNYLRVGFHPDGSWRIYKLRPDFHPADKVQLEDDITASVVLPQEALRRLDPLVSNPSVKLVENCEELLFQRPDDAIHRGFDHQAEADIASPGTFLSNFEPLDVDQARAIVSHVVEFDRFTEPMKKLLSDFVANPETGHVVSSAYPRIVDGKPSKNPRYLQKRPDRVNPVDTYLSEIGARLDREIPIPDPVHFPVNAVLAGRRNNPPDRALGIPPLAVFSPIHYQELPELFMDFVCSLTGKSPSTTGFGSEGALTKGPFNALWPVVDLNNALISMILTGYAGFTTAAGYVGPDYRVDHDISMLVPEIWCRMNAHERNPDFLLKNGLLEKIEDFDHQGRRVLASRLGYRITEVFVERYLGRLFEMPDTVFTQELLRPETQDLDVFVEGVNSIVEGQKHVALSYFEDGSAEAACPPLRALLEIMAHGQFDGKTVDDPSIRQMFTREAVLASDWYRERLQVKQQRDIALWQRHRLTLEGYTLVDPLADRIDIDELKRTVASQLARISSPEYLTELQGTIGADPFRRQMPAERT